MGDQLAFLYRIQPARPEMLVQGPTEKEADLVDQHFSYLQTLLNEGILIMAGRTQNSDKSSFGIVIFRAFSEQEARKIMEADPAVKHGIMRADLFPYKVALMETKCE